MKCAVDSDDILIKKEGCVQVSTELCDSGYMATYDNIEFPLNAIDACCRCRLGEACPYCMDELNCTDAELAEFVTQDEDCFAPPTTTPMSPSLDLSPPPPLPPAESSSPPTYIYFLFAAAFLLFVYLAFRRFFVTVSS